MNDNVTRLLLIAENAADAQLVKERLGTAAGGDVFELGCADRLANGLARLSSERFDEEISERKRMLQMLNIQRDLGLLLGATGDLAEALSFVLETVCGIEGIDCGGVYLADAATGALDLIAHRGLTREFTQLAAHYDADSPNARIVRTGQPLYGRYPELRYDENLTLQQEGLRALAVIPICHAGQTLAVLNLASHTHDAVPADTRLALEAIAAQIGGALARLRAQAALKANQQDLQALFDTVDDCMFILSADGRILQTNSAAQKRLGYPAEELQGMSVLDVHPPERRAEAAAIVAGMLAGDTDLCPVPLISKDGAIIPVETRVTHGRWAGQDVLIGISRDITERQRIEQDLQAERDFAQQVMATMGQGLTVTDSQSRFEFVNPAYARLLGCTPEELIGKQPADVAPPEDRGVLDHARTERRTGKTTTYETHLRRVDGSLVPVLITGAPRWRDGQVAGAIAVVTDLTERKCVEAALARQAEELARSNAELEQFASIVSHDLQQPLRMVSGFTHLLDEHWAGQSDTNSQEYMSFIVDGARRMQCLINDLLEYSRVGSRGKPFQPTDAAVALNDALWDLKPDIEDTGATVTFDPLPTVASDVTQLAQLFQNLIGNAIKFRGAESPQIHIGVQRAGDCWQFSVRDNGIGIAAQDHALIFGIFQRLHAQDEYPGTGIGLAVCQRIVERHGGRIWVESALGQGTTFHFTLPA